MKHQASEILHLVIETLKDHKAVDVVSIPLKGKTDIADYMVIASGTSKRHLTSMAEHLREKIKTKGIRTPLEGEQQGEWLLLDAYDVIVHLFVPETRALYDLEKLWG